MFNRDFYLNKSYIVIEYLEDNKLRMQYIAPIEKTETIRSAIGFIDDANLYVEGA